MRRHSRIIGGVAGFMAMSGLLAAPIPAAAQFELTTGVGVAERFSDNVDQEPDGEETSAFQTDVTPSIGLRWTGARVTTALDLELTARHQTAGDEKGVELLPNVAGFGTAEISEDLLFFDAAASARTELLNTRQADIEANRGIVQTYSGSPYIVGRFGDFADAELRYRYQQLISGDSENSSARGGDGDVSDSATHTASVALNSGADFARILWSLSGSASESIRKENSNVSRHDVALDLEYVLDRSFSLLGGVGYEEFDENDPNEDFNGPTWNVGFRWRPGPRTELTATYGQREDSENLRAALRYDIGPRTRLTASYSEELETAEERLQRSLDFIAIDPDTGELIDSRTGLPFDPDTSLTSVDSGTRRTRTFRLAVAGTRGRNTFSVQGTVEKSEEFNALGQASDEDGYGVSASWTRRLSPRAAVGLSGGYDRTEFEADDRTDQEINVGTSYTYQVFTNISAFGRYSFNTQISDNEQDEFVENQVTVGVRMTF